MPFFYFDIENSETLTEDEGFVLPSLQEAKEEAAGYLIEAARSHLKPDGENQEIHCTVKDEQKRPLVRLRLALELAAIK